MRQTVVDGIWVSRLILRNDFFGLKKKFLSTHLTVSSDVYGRPDLFLMHKQPSSFNFFCHFQISIAVGDCFENSLTNACFTLMFDCDQSYSNTQNAFNLPVKGIKISAKIKTLSIKF